MRRGASFPQHPTPHRSGGGMLDEADYSPDNLSPFDASAAIVRNIASFLTLSDAASLASMAGGGGGASTPADSWVVGDGFGEGDASWSLATPPTPALVALSPGATPAASYRGPIDYIDIGRARNDSEEDCSDALEFILQERRRKWAQEKLATAVFMHPQSLRSFCLDAYQAAQAIRRQQQEKLKEGPDPETMVEPTKPRRRRGKAQRRLRFVHELIDWIFHNVPLSVLLDVLDALGGVTLDTSFASFKITVNSINGAIGALGYVIRLVWDGIANFNPFHLLEAIISLQFNAMGKTSEVLVSGIQSVATGVESASSIALHRLSAANLSVKRTGSSNSLVGNGSLRRGRSYNSKLNKKLLRKMSSINDAARVVSYLESGDDTGGLTRHAMSRTRRMMHYSVSLRPFVATVAVSSTGSPPIPCDNDYSVADGSSSSLVSYRDGHDAGETTPNGSPLICSPQSFPPTPRSRQMVLTRGSQFADDVVFLARDRLRIHDGLESHDERTREMARALREGKRLAIFDVNGANGIELTCGQHIATKVGSMQYASTRSMVPILRNCYVYFEITVMPRMHTDASVAAAPITLSIGLSTVEMPPNTLVGSWQGSVGLCTTGQIFSAGQWSSPTDPSTGAYGQNATVGCLVFLDDHSAFETWDGVMVNASVTFCINGVLVPPVSNALSHASSNESGSASDQSTDSSPGMPIDTAEVASPTLPTLLVPASEELYPTVTLQTPTTAVMCRFSSEDALASSRECIGAPPGVTVYAVDGSVMFEDHE